ncbi:uncharacterized protein Pyn_22245 [Prunus yedoensis var. nudiflora]|uniref:Uncharacterized protein n=1 Tax=Prunus yedoensis var. nudiflora TaxID=2094558 RepID=A0A314ZTD6_PRUYE|nr:uncharacterized protein Pyn_22245 [Prunus yedoensis var. nudiflora]
MLQKPDPGHNYAKLMEEYSSKKDGKLPTHTEVTVERSKESRTVTYVVEPASTNALKAVHFSKTERQKQLLD